MPACGRRCHAAAVLGYVFVAVAFTWPLPLRLADGLLGSPSGDTGIYIWNLWLFRHEVVAHQRLPFATHEILALAPPVPLALHNFTIFANALAFPLLAWLSPVTTYNLLLIAAGPAAAYAMFLFARLRAQDDAAAWLAGLLFGFSPFMSARATEHFSLTLAAPLPIFALLLYRFMHEPTGRLAVAAGLAVAWAFFCDVYYAVYCLLVTAFFVTCSAVSVRPASMPTPLPAVRVVDVALLSMAGLVVAVLVTGGWRFGVRGTEVSITNLFTPVLVLTTLFVLRIWLAVRPRLGWSSRRVNHRHFRLALFAAITCLAVLTPVLFAASAQFGESGWITRRVVWRHSEPGLDLVGLLAPNPLHPWFGALSAEWLRTLPNGLVENVGAVSWVALLTVVSAATLSRFRPPAVWIVFTALFTALALGPFIHVAGHATYVPTPWALLRYLPVFGAARMPTRMAVMVTFCVAVLFALALQHVRRRSRHPTLLAAGVGILLLFELLPAPRRIHPPAIPAILSAIAADPQPVSVLNVPLGLRDGMRSAGHISTEALLHQTAHQKPIVGAYLSRLPRRAFTKYRRNPMTRALLQLSERHPISGELHRTAISRADELVTEVNLGYIVIDRSEAPPGLIEFVLEAFDVTSIGREAKIDVYRVNRHGPVGLRSSGQSVRASRHLSDR